MSYNTAGINIKNYDVTQMISLFKMLRDFNLLEREDPKKVEAIAKIFLEKVEKSPKPLPAINQLIQIFQPWFNLKKFLVTQKKITDTVFQMIERLEESCSTHVEINDKKLTLYEEIKKFPDLAAFTPLAQAITKKIINDIGSNDHFKFLTFIDPKHVQINQVTRSTKCLLLARKFFYAYKETANKGYQKIAKEAFLSYPPNMLYESHLTMLIDMLRKGSPEEKSRAKSLLEVQEGDISNMKDMKTILYLDIVYRDENNPKLAVEHIRTLLPELTSLSDIQAYTYLELYYLFKIQPLPVADIKERLAKSDEQTFYRFYYEYLLERQEDPTRLPSKEALEAFKYTACVMSSFDKFGSCAFDILCLQLLEELPEEVKLLLHA